MGPSNSRIMYDVLRALRDARPHELDSDTLPSIVGATKADVLVALDALLAEGLAAGLPLRSITGLDDVLHARITPEGLRELDGSKPQTATYVTHVQGSVGAIGNNAQGFVNYQQCWNAVQNTVNLDALASELATLRNQIQKNASSLSDYEIMGALAEAQRNAEQHHGSKVLEALSRVGKAGLDLALKAGTDVAARLIERALYGPTP